MSKCMETQEINLEKLNDRLRVIENRLARFESELNNFKSSGYTRNEEVLRPAATSLPNEKVNEDEKGLESRIGRIGLPWIGNIVLFFAVLILTEYLITNGHNLVSLFTGLLAVGLILLVSTYLRKSNFTLSVLLNINGQIIMFYQVMRVHFFNDNPLSENIFLVIMVLLLISGYQVYISIKDKSQVYGFISVAFILFTAILSDSTHVTLPLTTLSAVLVVYCFRSMKWKFLLFSGIIMCYLTYFFWLFGNPIMGHSFQMLTDHNFGYIYLFALGSVFSVLPLLYKSDNSLNDTLISSIILNGIFFTMTLTFITLKFFSSNYVILFSLITLSCLIYSVFLRSNTTWKFSSAFYALYGFLAMSISI